MGKNEKVRQRSRHEDKDGKDASLVNKAGNREKDEEKVKRMCESAIIKVYGSLEKYYENLAKESKDSFPHLKLLFEYYIGKPKETKDIKMDVNKNFPEWLDE